MKAVYGGRYARASGASAGLRVVGGRGILERALANVRLPAVITSPSAWAAFSACGVRLDPRSLTMAQRLEVSYLDDLKRQIGAARCVVGVGGGLALDAAKYVASEERLPLILIPTCTSASAAFTSFVALRQGRILRARMLPLSGVAVLVDDDLIERAPARLNRAGVGDIISAHTALWDWDHGQYATAPWDPEIASAMQSHLTELESLAPELAGPTSDSLRQLVRIHTQIGSYAQELGHLRFNSGSDHAFAACLEYVTDRHYLHGEAVALGTLIMAEAQDNNSRWVKRILDVAQVRYTPEGIGADWSEVRRALETLPEYVARAGRPWSAASDFSIDTDRLRRLQDLIEE